MSEPNGYLLHGTAFSSKEAAFKALVSNQEQEAWFHKIWNENAQPYYFEPQPQLTIPKSVADKLDKDDANNKTVLDWFFATEMIVINDENELKRREDEILRRRAIVSIYGASKALGVDLVKVVEG
jgi:hypothetical protein